MNDALFARAPYIEPRLMNPLALAYMGDAVYEMYIRQYVLSLPGQKPHHLHRQAVRFVSAKAQSRALEKLTPLLSEEEADIVRRGRNAKSGSSPKNADILEYRHSTAFECLLGYLYCTKRYDRLRELMDAVLHDEKGVDG